MPLHDIAILGGFITAFGLLLALGRYFGAYRKDRRQHGD
jgi:hypothetical protein